MIIVSCYKVIDESPSSNFKSQILNPKSLSELSGLSSLVVKRVSQSVNLKSNILNPKSLSDLSTFVVKRVNQCINQNLNPKSLNYHRLSLGYSLLSL
jgi:hypothetical protein